MAHMPETPADPAPMQYGCSCVHATAIELTGRVDDVLKTLLASVIIEDSDRHNSSNFPL